MLLENIEDVRKVINASKATSFDKLFNHLFNTEQKYIFPLIGNALYEKLATFYNNPDADVLTRSDMNTDFNSDFYVVVPEKDKAYARLLYITQQAIAHLAFYEGFDLLNTFVSDAGFKRQESETTKSLFKYQEDNIRNYYRDNGFNMLDHMLAFLETNITHFPEYLPLLAANKARIIPDTRTFNSIINIRNSRIVFLRMIQHMKTVEELELTPVLGAANMKIITDGLAASIVPDKVISILPYLRNVVAWYTTVMLMEETGADFTDRGLYFEGIKGGIAMSDVKLPTPDSRVAILVERNKNVALSYMGLLKRYLSDNAAVWNDFSDPRSRMPYRDNAGKKTFWT
jgi:hypothetical protein